MTEQPLSGTLPARGKREQGESHPGSLSCPAVTPITSSHMTLAKANHTAMPKFTGWGCIVLLRVGAPQ